MADEAEQPLLDRGAIHQSSSARETSSSHYQQARTFQLSSESTPLLSRREDDGLLAYGTGSTRRPSTDSGPAFSDRVPRKPGSRLRWPMMFILVLLTGILTVLIFAFAAPAAVRRYVEEATVFKPTDLSIDSSIPDGVRARVQGDFVVNASRIQKGAVRNIGRFATWIGREVETGQFEVEVYLPEYGNILVGTASLPPIRVAIRNGHTNHVDFMADLAAGDIPGIRAVAMDWLEGRLGPLRVKGRADLHLRSGFLGLGMQTVSKSMVFQEDDFPALPKVKVNKLTVRDTPAQKRGMVVDASIAALVDFPFAIRIPPLGFEALVPNCSPGERYISVADVRSKEVQIKPGQPTNVNIIGLVQGLSEDLTTTCPGKKDSPLDLLVRSYVNGLRTTIYVRGADEPSSGTPSWMVDLLKSVTVPFQFTGHALDNLIQNFTMSNVHFSLPNPLADPDSPEALPRISALVNVVVGLPKQLNLTLDIPQIRADADVYYQGDKLGVLELHEWQPANSTRVLDKNGTAALFVNFTMNDAPLRVTDEDVLTDILQSLIFEGRPIQLQIAAAVDTEVATGLGNVTVRGIPAEGKVNVKPPYGGSMNQLNPRIESLELGPTTESSAHIKTRMNITNPTEYSATVPLADFALLYNITTVAHVTTHDVSIVPGVNTGIPVDFLWSPLDAGGSDGVNAGRELMSQYVSGSNTTVTVQTHRGTIPSLPDLGQALSKLGLKLQVPKVPIPRKPGNEPDNDDDGPHFIQSAMYVFLCMRLTDCLRTRTYLDSRMHLWSSTAEFTLSSPLLKTTVQTTSINATAFYEQSEPIGRIDYHQPFDVPPGISHSPRLPVDLDLGSIGYDALKDALGGSLKMSAVAMVGVRIGNYTDIITYRGNGISAHVRI